MGRLSRLRQPKIEHFRRALLREHHVGTLDVTVYDLIGVGRLQRGCDLTRNPDDLIQLQRPLLYAGIESLALDILHDDEGRRLRAMWGSARDGLINLENRGDVGMMELRGGLGFPVKPGPVFFSCQRRRWQYLQGDRSA